MDLMYRLVEGGANLFDAAAGILFPFFCMNLKDKYRNNSKFWLYTILFIVALSLVQDKPKSYSIQFIIIIAIITTYSTIFLKEIFLEKLLYSFLFLIVLMVSSILASTSFSILTGKGTDYVSSVESMFRLYSLLYNKLIIIFFLGLIVFNRRKIKIDYKEWIIVIAFLLCIVCMSVATLEIARYYEINEEYAKYMFILVLGIILFSIVSIMCVYKLNTQHKYILENEVLKAKLHEEKIMLEKNQIMYEENCILRHDLKRYLTTVQGLLVNEKIGEAKKYIEDTVGKNFDNNIIVFTNSSVVNVVLNDMKNKCEKSKIKFDIYVGGEIPENIELDMGVILSNLLENAYEAEVKEKDRNRIINLKLVRQKGMYLINLENFIGDSVIHNNPNMNTSKKNSSHHGIGIKSVRKMVERGEGSYSYFEKEDRFITEIILPI